MSGTHTIDQCTFPSVHSMNVSKALGPPHPPATYEYGVPLHSFVKRGRHEDADEYMVGLLDFIEMEETLRRPSLPGGHIAPTLMSHLFGFDMRSQVGKRSRALKMHGGHMPFGFHELLCNLEPAQLPRLGLV